MHKLRAALERHIPQIRITAEKTYTTPVGPALELQGHMADLSKEASEFRLTHFEHGGGYYASISAIRSRDGRAALDRFKGGFGEGSEKPRLVHESPDDVGYEFWSPKLHSQMGGREGMVRQMGRRITEKNY